MGTGTHGKGTVQAMVDLERVENSRRRRPQGEPLGVMKLTIQQFFLVDGESTQWQGVQPDVALPDPASHIESGERFLDNAIPFSRIDPLPAALLSHPNWDVAVLREKSRARQALEPTFAKVTARGEYLSARRNETTVALQRESWLAQRTKDHDELERLDPKVEAGPERFRVKLVEYGPVAPNTESPKRAKGATHIDRWKENLARDPWVEEAMLLIADMAGSKAPTKTVAVQSK